MLFQYKDNEGIDNVVADGVILKLPYFGEYENTGKPYVRFRLKFGALKKPDGGYSSKVVNVLSNDANAIDLLRYVDNGEPVFLSGIKVVDDYMSERKQRRVYCIRATTILPVRRLNKAIGWLEESKQREEKIYGDVAKKLDSGITYDGYEEEELDLDF